MVGGDVTEVHLPFLIAIRLLCNFGMKDQDSLVAPLLQVIPHRFSVDGEEGDREAVLINVLLL